MQSPSAADLRNLDLFRGLSDEDLSELASWFEVREVDPGEILTREGASGYDFTVLGTAVAIVTHGDDVVRRLGPGDFFGEAAILGKGRRTATVKAEKAGSVWVLFGTRFRELGTRFPELMAEVERVLNERQD